MRYFLNDNKLAVITALVTLVLGVVAVVTAIRFYQLRQQAVAPTAPEEPVAAGLTPTPTLQLPPTTQACSLSFSVPSPTPSATITLTPTPTATPTPKPPTPSPTPTPRPTTTPTNTPTPTPTLPPTAQCIEIKIYDTNWNILTPTQLVNLSAGDRVRFAVLGSSTAGIFDKAIFSINGVLTPEVTQKKPSTEEFYYEYTITEADLGTTFTVKAWLHHAGLDSWF